MLFGMLVHSKEGKLCLEDLDGVVELDFSQLVGSISLTLAYWIKLILCETTGPT